MLVSWQSACLLLALRVGVVFFSCNLLRVLRCMLFQLVSLSQGLERDFDGFGE